MIPIQLKSNDSSILDSVDTLEKIEQYYQEDHQFKEAINQLRDLALKTEVEETFKWNFPTYTLKNKNVFAICKFKNHFGIWFFNGVFLKDKKGILENAQEGKTKAMRHWKFKALEGINTKVVLAYMNEAIENQKNGRVFNPIKKKTSKTPIPKVLKEALIKKDNALKAFEKLTLYKQNEYAEYISTAKQEKTKLTRLEKIIPLIIKGKGLNDAYR